MRLATIELEIPETGQNGRVFLNRELLRETSVAVLEKEFAATFVDPEDEPRMDLIRQLLSSNEPVVVTVHPSESSPPEFHAFLKDPSRPDEPLFACVLAPLPVVAEMVAAAPQILFETATFQAMAADTAPGRMLAALDAWSRRLWPGLPVPKFVLSPWPLENVTDSLSPLPPVKVLGGPQSAPSDLNRSDYPTLEELSA